MTEYHFVLTAQRFGAGGTEIVTTHGTLTLNPQATRAEAFEFARNDLRKRTGWTSDPNILFFSLEPNQINAAAPVAAN